MKRTRIRDIRNQEFISATLSATFERGFHAVTMADIARKLGATAASINYYFGSKDRLMAETMTHLLGLLRQEHVMALSQAHTPKERLRAIVELKIIFLLRLFDDLNFVIFVSVSKVLDRLFL